MYHLMNQSLATLAKLTQQSLILVCLTILSHSAFACGLELPNESWLDKVFVSKNQTVLIRDLEKTPNKKMIYLNGIISQKVSHGVYKFRDKSGAINIHISDAVRKGRTFKSSERLYFYAQVEHKSCGSILITVKEIKANLS